MVRSESTWAPCGRCGSSGPVDRLVCAACGSALPGPASRPAAEDGQRGWASVLFADVVGSTPMILGRDPEDARTLLEGLVAEMTRAAGAFGGHVRPTGDGVKAVFGAPLGLEDHARRACLAALQMQSVLGTTAGPSRPTVLLRVGIDAGDVVVHRDRDGYESHGTPVHVAAKLQQSAPPGGILVSSIVASLVQGFIRVEGRRAVDVGGRPVNVYEVLGSTTARSRFEAASTRGLSPFVGREAELEDLARVADAVRHSGAGTSRLVVGDAGIGKSRLLWEFSRSRVASGWRVFAMTANALRGVAGPSPMADLLRGVFGVEPADDADRIARRIDAAGSGADLAPLLAVLDPAGPGQQWLSLSGAERNARTRQAVANALRHAARQHPILLLVHDFQWADRETADLVDALDPLIASEPVLLLLESRTAPPPATPSTRSPPIAELTVGPLANPSAVALFRTLVGNDAGLILSESTVVSRAEGSPLFLEEAVRMIAGAHDVDKHAGTSSSPAPREVRDVPATVKDVLATRVSHIPERDRLVLQAASVLGRETLVSTLQHLVAGSSSMMRSTLSSLRANGFIERTGRGRVAKIRFKHAFVHEVVYDGVLRVRRRELHARAIAAIQQDSPESHYLLSEQLAHHAEESQQTDLALTHLQSAARMAFERSAMHRALALLERAMGLVAKLPATSSLSERAVDLLLDKRNVLIALGRMQQVTDVIHEASRHLLASNDPVRACRVAAYACGDHWMNRRHVQAVDAGMQALTLAARLGDNRLLVPTRQYLGGALADLNRYEQARSVLTDNVLALSGASRLERYGMTGVPLVFALAVRGLTHGEQGALDAALTDARDALGVAREADDLFSMHGASVALGCVQIERGDVDSALVTLASALDGDPGQVRFWLPVLGPAYALALLLHGDAAAAAQWMRNTFPAPGRRRSALASMSLATAAEVYLRLGRTADALDVASELRERSRASGERGFEARALHLIGLCIARGAAPDLRAAESMLEAALRLADELGMPIHAAHCHIALVGLSQARGTSDAAHHLSLASLQFLKSGVDAGKRQVLQVP